MNGDAIAHLSRTFGAIAAGRECRRLLQSEAIRRQSETVTFRDAGIDVDAWPQPDGSMNNMAGHACLAALADRQEAVFDRSAESLHCESNMPVARPHRSPVAPGGDSWTLNNSID